MSDRQSFFLVIEGLDGSGKSEISRRLAELMRTTLDDRVMLTYEPHDPSAAGLYIRRVLRKKIVVSSRTLAQAFALNRSDHNERVIGPYLDQDGRRVVLCDRYIMSSLVYNSSHDLPMQDVWDMNSAARRPDLTLFLDATAEICYARMGARGGNRDLFETNLAESRTRYFEAIEFLRRRGEHVQVIDANPDLLVVLNSIIDALRAHGPRWLTLQKLMFLEATAPAILAPPPLELERWMRDFVDRYTVTALGDLTADDGIRRLVAAEVNRLPLDELAALMMNFLHTDRRYRFESAWPGQPIDYTVIRPNGETGGLVILQDERRWEGVMRALESEFIAPHYSIRRDSIQFVVALDPSHAGEEVAQFVPDTGAVPVEMYGRGTLIQYFTRHITRRVLADPLASGSQPPQLSMDLPDSGVLAEDWSLAAALAQHAATPEVTHEQEGVDHEAEAYAYEFAPPVEPPDAASYAVAEPRDWAGNPDLPASPSDEGAEGVNALEPAAESGDEAMWPAAYGFEAEAVAETPDQAAWPAASAADAEPDDSARYEAAWQAVYLQGMTAPEPEPEVTSQTETPAVWQDEAIEAGTETQEAPEFAPVLEDANNWSFDDAPELNGPEQEPAVETDEVLWPAHYVLVEDPDLAEEHQPQARAEEAEAWSLAAVPGMIEPEAATEMEDAAAWAGADSFQPVEPALEAELVIEADEEPSWPLASVVEALQAQSETAGGPAEAPQQPAALPEAEYEPQWSFAVAPETPEPEAEALEQAGWPIASTAEPETDTPALTEADSELAWEIVYALANAEPAQAEAEVEAEADWMAEAAPEAEPATAAAQPEAPAEDWVTAAARGYVFAPFPWGEEAPAEADIPSEPEPVTAPAPGYDLRPVEPVEPVAPPEPTGHAAHDPYADSLRDELPWRARWSALRGKRDTAEQRPVRLAQEIAPIEPAAHDATASERDAMPAHDAQEPGAEE